MTAFHTIAIPHDDILAGRLTMDVFAADLWEVFQGRGPDEYRDPRLFFQKTYVTGGLRQLIDVVQQRLRGAGGDPVLQLQTPFGGGKTHALIALYHMAGEWGAKRVVMVGTAKGARDTLWGMLEQQLTGQKSALGDDQVAPGREALRELLSRHQPTLILMDEVLEYITKAAGIKVGDSTLAAQSIAFMHELTEVVSTLDRVSLVITLPSSLLEHYDEQSERLFQQLQRVAGRVEKIYTPVQENEITSVIRRRLFAQMDEGHAANVVNQFMDYAATQGVLPTGGDPSEYRRRFEAAYPFLPDVVDVLYERWGSLTTFQRTRGVLRLLALVIYSLRDQNIPYISLADFDLAEQQIRRELLKHTGQEFDSVIAADVTAPDAGAGKVNAELGRAYQGLSLGTRAATTIFLYSFSGGVERGATLVDIKRNATTMENPANSVAEAVEQLRTKLFFLQERGAKYFFTNQPNLNRIVLMRMENVKDRELWEAERDLLKLSVQRKTARYSERQGLKVYIWPEDIAGIPDTAELKLLVLPSVDDAQMREILSTKGSTPRVERNTLFFLAPIANERTPFVTLLRRTLAYRALLADTTLNLKEQATEVHNSLKKAEGDLGEALRRAYRRLYLPSRDGLKESDLGIPTYGESKSLDEEVYDKLRLDGEILENIAPLVIKERYLQGRDWVQTEQLYQSGLRTPGETRAVSQSVWVNSIAQGVRTGLFGLGELEGGEPRYQFFKTEPSVSLTGDEIIMRAEVCLAQIAERQREPEYEPKGTAGTGGIWEPTPTPPPGSEPPREPGAAPARQPVRTSLRLTFSVPKGKVAGLMGVMNLLQSKFERMDVTLSVDQGQLSEQDYEDKIREAFRQMGVDVRE